MQTLQGYFQLIWPLIEAIFGPNYSEGSTSCVDGWASYNSSTPWTRVHWAISGRDFYNEQICKSLLLTYFPVIKDE